MSQCLSLKINKLISKQKLKNEIINLGYKHIEKDYFKYFEKNDFLSFSGVELTIYINKNKIEIYTRTAGLRSYYDFEYQNITIKKLKKTFGGYVIDPDSKEKRYLDLNGYENLKLSPIERGCGLAYHRYCGGIMRLIMMTNKLNIGEYAPYISEFHPDTNIANIMIPFFVSIFEDFMKTFFIRYINHNKDKINMSKKIDKKISFDDLEQISLGNKSFGEVIADNLSFQNLKILQESYKSLIGIDIQNILDKKKKVKSKNEYNLYDELKNIIQIRHKIIHEAEFIYINKNKLEDYIDIFDEIGKTFIKYFENKGLILNLNDI